MQSIKKCFFIDDDEDDRDFFCTAMTEIDHSIQCLFAKNGLDAIAQLQKDNSLLPNYIFIDMNMPLMDGKECLKEIKSMHRLQDIPVYIYSTFLAPKLIAEILDIGAADFLVKPSNMKDLVAMLQKIVK